MINSEISDHVTFDGYFGEKCYVFFAKESILIFGGSGSIKGEQLPIGSRFGWLFWGFTKLVYWVGNKIYSKA